MDKTNKVLLLFKCYSIAISKVYFEESTKSVTASTLDSRSFFMNQIFTTELIE